MAKDWAPLQDEIRDLWHIKRKSLKEVMHVMRVQHNFIASERAYRMQLQKWGYMRYNTQRLHGRHHESVDKESVISPVSEITSSGNQHLSNLPVIATSRSSHDAVDATGTTLVENDLYLSNPQFGAMGGPLPAITFPLVSDRRDLDDKSPLHHAVIRKDKSLISALLRSGTAISLRDRFGNNPIHYGVLAEETEIAQLLLQFGADAKSKGQQGRSPLHMAASLSHLELARILLQHGSLVSQHDDKGDTPLHLALLPFSAGKESQKLLMLLLEAGANVNAPNELGMTPFHQLMELQYPTAILHRHVTRNITTAMAFLKHGADVARPFPDGRMPIEVFLMRSNDTWALKDCNVNSLAQPPENSLIAELLDKCGMSRILMPSGEPLPHYYVRTLYGDEEVDRRLNVRICNLADPQMLSGNGNTLLHEVMQNDHLNGQFDIGELVGDLLRRGFDLNSRNKEGHTPLHLFFKVCDPVQHYLPFRKIIDEMDGYHISPWVRDNSGKCVLFEAAPKGVMYDSGFLKTLLRNDLNREPGALEVWPEWEAARLAIRWKHARALMSKGPLGLATVLSGGLQELAYVVLAEKHLGAAKSMFNTQEADGIRRQRAYIAEVLQDCRGRHIKINMRFYDELLALCRYEEPEDPPPPSPRKGMKGPIRTSDENNSVRTHHWPYQYRDPAYSFLADPWEDRCGSRSCMCTRWEQ